MGKDNYAHGNIGTRLESESMQITEIEQRRTKLTIGGVYQIRESYVDSAVFRPTEGAHRHTVGYSYTELCQGVLDGANDIMDGVLPYEEEELIDEEIENA